MIKPKLKYYLLTVVLLVSFSEKEVFSQQLRVASYNIRYDNPQDSLDNWKYRKNIVSKLIQFHDFDILGTQEGLHHQLEELKEKLPEYTYIGVGRDDGENSGEYSAIFYKTGKFKLLEKGNFWLSEDPSKPNKGWDAALPRITSWGKFKEKESGFEFYFFNAHFDHVGKTARKESSKLILKKINEIAKGAPTLFAGDLNVDQNSASYNIMSSSVRLTDSYDKAALRYGPKGTFNGFKVNSRSESRIDHIFVTDSFEVLRHGVLTDTYKTDMEKIQELKNSGDHPEEISLHKNKARLPSDHYPVLIVTSVKSERSN